MNVHEFAELAAGNALHALSPEDQQAYAAALAVHPEWAAIADADASTAADLADGVAEVAPPAHVREALLAAIATASPVEPEPPVEDSGTGGEPAPNTEAIQTVSRRQWTRGLLALAASLVLLVALGTGVAMIGDRLYEPAAVVAQNEIESAPDAQTSTAKVKGGGHATLKWSDEVGKAVVVTEGVAELDADQSYEMWFAREGVMVSAGVFTTDADGSATTLLNAPIQEGDEAVAITIEEEGGSPTGEPTGEPITTLPTT